MMDTIRVFSSRGVVSAVQMILLAVFLLAGPAIADVNSVMASIIYRFP